MPTYEMFWDCDYCDSRKLLGKTHRHCPNCGAAQDPARRYFPPESEKVLATDHAFVGVDWVCERCDSPNSNAATHCTNCGDARDGVEEDVERKDEVLAGQQAGAYVKTPAVFEPPLPPAPSIWTPGRIAAVVFVAAAMVAMVVGALLWSAPTGVEVISHSWTREVRVEVYRSVRDGSWCDHKPSDAYGVSRSRKQRSTRQIPDGESCSTVNSDNGDGTFSTSQQCTTTYRSEPVYDDWCSYTVDRWRHDHTETAEGDGLTPQPHWPPVSTTDCRRLGCTRVGGRRGTYRVSLTDNDGTSHLCDFSQERWSSMAVGSRWTGKKRVLLDMLVCDGLVPEEAP